MYTCKSIFAKSLQFFSILLSFFCTVFCLIHDFVFLTHPLALWLSFWKIHFYAEVTIRVYHSNIDCIRTCHAIEYINVITCHEQGIRTYYWRPIISALKIFPSSHYAPAFCLYLAASMSFVNYFETNHYLLVLLWNLRNDDSSFSDGTKSLYIFCAFQVEPVARARA